MNKLHIVTDDLEIEFESDSYNIADVKLAIVTILEALNDRTKTRRCQTKMEPATSETSGTYNFRSHVRTENI